MRLTSVKLSGFKSFVDPVTIAVPGQLVGVVSLTVVDGRVTRIYSIANPDKLGRVDTEADLAR